MPSDDGTCSRCGKAYACAPETFIPGARLPGEPAYIIRRGPTNESKSGSLIADFCSAPCMLEWIADDAGTEDTLLY